LRWLTNRRNHDSLDDEQRLEDGLPQMPTFGPPQAPLNLRFARDSGPTDEAGESHRLGHGEVDGVWAMPDRSWLRPVINSYFARCKDALAYWILFVFSQSNSRFSTACSCCNSVFSPTTLSGSISSAYLGILLESRPSRICRAIAFTLYEESANSCAPIAAVASRGAPK